MKILGIETSCDETSAAVVEDGRRILSNVVTSSLKEHKKFGGVIPEIASRRQLECIQRIVDEALQEAGAQVKDIDTIAVTQSPGLIGSLLVGISFARALSYTLKKPFIPIDHVKAHLYANFLTFSNNGFKQPRLPAIGLVVSGGHTNLFYIKNFKNIKLIGSTRDDAAGEAFDKVARILRLGYPGGPQIDTLAQQAKKTHLQFTCAELPDTLDFSFSGIKTAVLYHTRKHQNDPGYCVKDVAFAFQNSIVSVLIKKSLAACRRYKTKTLLVGGGVAANSQLRSQLTQEAQREGIDCFIPPLALCLDNAAMVAGLAYQERK
ncbi:MAG TPA: tRNA (adenosine(37)-N6)-threonylcarbamoyltransferase complex transferase subunit TsaD [Candidatus Omnitrophota bacterium]|nr:tRNA (adenosine(37)-N6)-threonylcarbamoyltransferase complex transferase subunit TsaD [Candidatus Omnitrophota bacterium]